MPSRHVLHINVVNFLVAVASAADSALRGRAVAVATVGAARRVVLDMSAVAHESGVRRGMLLESARRACRDLRVVDPAPRLYERAHDAMVAEACRISPRVEPAGPGHVFVDLSGTERLWGDPVDSSARLQRAIRSKFGFDPAVGVATNKLMSKVATRVIKPTGLCRVVGGCEQDFLAPLPVRLLPGIDPAVISHIEQFNILLINDLSIISERQLQSVFGGLGSDVYRMARGIDEAPVRAAGDPAPAVRESVVFEGQTNDDAVVERELFGLVARAGAALRRMGMGARRLGLVVRYADSSRGQAGRTLREPLNGDISLFEQFEAMMAVAHNRRIRLNDIAISCTNLCSPYGGDAVQLDLFDTGVVKRAQEGALMSAMDKVRTMFGANVVGFGRQRRIGA